jgi:ubiquinone/menaquinone biosynthesis C-methylase UbiE
MNEVHLKLCSSDEWAEGLKKYVIPGATNGVDLGEHLLEVGPGPGRTTDVLKDMAPKLTAVEIDSMLAGQLTERMAGTNVTVVEADATAMPFPEDHFSAAVSFTMMHHVPEVELQNKLFAEVARVVRAGGMFVGVDSFDSEDFRKLHVDDICVPLPPDTLEARLRAAGFSEVSVEPNDYVLQWRAKV